ncbi:hypothetical protein H4Q26_014282 [Puccinia striiformis f. sp. tritici PST-130]|nr:hypothetical protein H4Q26_014282 [Puccinia striiformis f. sp. tritici PST-130]
MSVGRNPTFFEPRVRQRDGQTVYNCTLCEGSEFLSIRKHAMGVRHRARVRERDDQIGHRQEEESKTKKNQRKDLDAMDRVARLLVSDDKDDSNGDVEIEVEDLIDAHLEEILRQEDVRLFEGQTDEDENENENEINPVERLRWFPFKNKMVRLTWLKTCVDFFGTRRVVVNRTHALASIARHLQQEPGYHDSL